MIGLVYCLHKERRERKKRRQQLLDEKRQATESMITTTAAITTILASLVTDTDTVKSSLTQQPVISMQAKLLSWLHYLLLWMEWIYYCHPGSFSMRYLRAEVC